MRRRPGGPGTSRSHAIRVALITTVLVLGIYSLGVVLLNLLVADRLLGEVDVRLSAQLAHLDVARLHVQNPVRPVLQGAGGNDLDDAPAFLWLVADTGKVSALSAGAPHLPTRRWTSAPVTVEVGTVPFRFVARRLDGNWVVAGQSIAEIPRVRSAFALPEAIVGLVLLVVVLAGSYLVGRRASAPLELVRRRQAEFTADASHELRTPLTVIEAEVDLALRSRRDPAADTALLERIAAEGRRLRRVVEDLLWLARSDSAPPLRAEEALCRLDAVASACAERFRPVSEARGVALDVQVEGRSPVWVAAPAEDIDRLTGVLVDNACRYAGSGGRVVVAVRCTPSRTSLSVDDSGPGIPTEEVPFIFDRFHRASASPGGTGLGLAIADAVVRASRGTWTVGRSPLGGAHLAVSWRRPVGRRGGPETAAPATGDARAPANAQSRS